MSHSRISILHLLCAVVMISVAGSLVDARAQTLPTTIIQGVVSDQTNGSAIAGALLRWNDTTRSVTGLTNANGAYAFSIPLVRSGQCEKVTIIATGNLYATSGRSLNICAGSTTPVNFLLAPLSASQIGTVSGQVVANLYGKLGLSNAQVSIYKQGLPLGLTTMTDANGFYSIPGVGFSTGLVMKVTTAAPPCITPIARGFSVSASQVTENFSVKAFENGSLACPPNYWSPDSDGSPSAAAAPAPQFVATPSRPLPSDENAAPPPLSVDPTIQWQLATPDGILMNANVGSWNSGHVNDIVKIGSNEIVVGANMSGVWSVAWTSVSSAAAPLSWNWPSLGVNSLVQGVDGTQHLYAGTGDRYGAIPSGFLFETDTSTIAPLGNWVADTKPPCNNVEKILTLPTLRYIVLACDTGIWWSPIPPPPAAHGTYTWKAALPGTGVPLSAISGLFEGLAPGPVIAGTPQASIVVAKGGAALINGKPKGLIFYGSWSNGDLYLNASAIGLYTGTQAGRTSVASCGADPNQMYAVTNNAADPNNGLIGAVWRSVDGGKSWSAVNVPSNGGNQGDYNQAIAVNPSNCLSFAIAWRERVLISYDAGNSYVGLDSTCGGDASCQGNLHGDYHAVMFDPNDPQQLWIGGDGGVASAYPVFQGSTPTFNSIYNEHLSDLEVFTATASATAGTPNGNQPWGLVGAVLQDNGAIYSDLGGNQWWSQMADSDGISVAFSGAGPGTATGSPGDTLVFSDSSDTAIWSSETWTGTVMQGHGPVPPNINAGGPGVLSEVRAPKFMNGKGELMYEIGTGLTNRSLVYGLFSDAQGGDLHWEPIGDVGSGLNVNALSSTDGNPVFVGTSEGKIFTLTPQSGTPVQWPINAPAAGSVQAISEVFPTVAFAALNNGAGSGFIVSFNGVSWSALGGGLPTSRPFLGVAAPNLGSLFAADTQTVYVSHDLGNTWLLATTGLPALDMAFAGPGGTHTLRWAVQSDGLIHLYLASRGWSVFQAVLPTGP